MKKLVKLLTFVSFLFVFGQTAHAEGTNLKKSSFTQLQNELWIHGIQEITAETESEIQRKINDIGSLSATDFYPEELTQPLNKI